MILDRDGVLNCRPERARYVTSWREFEWLPGALEALRLLQDAGYRVMVVTNQAGIARGAMTRSGSGGDPSGHERGGRGGGRQDRGDLLLPA